MLIKTEKWGDSLGIRLPKAYVEQLWLEIGDDMEACIQNNEIMIRKCDRDETAEDVIASFYDMPYEEVLQHPDIVEKEGEIDWGEDVGDERIP
jgi:antitoxin MazE